MPQARSAVDRSDISILCKIGMKKEYFERMFPGAAAASGSFTPYVLPDLRPEHRCIYHVGVAGLLGAAVYGALTLCKRIIEHAFFRGCTADKGYL